MSSVRQSLDAETKIAAVAGHLIEDQFVEGEYRSPRGNYSRAETQPLYVVLPQLLGRSGRNG